MPSHASNPNKKKLRTFTAEHVKLRCLRCMSKATMPYATYAMTQTVGGGAIGCCFGGNGVLCGGQMVKYGPFVKRPRTLALLPTYAWARDRAQRRRRGAALAAEAAIDPDDIDENDGNDDLDFVVSRDFNINMRFTPEDMEAARIVPAAISVGGPTTLTGISTGLVATGNADLAERLKSTKTNSPAQKSAWQHALDVGAPNAARYQLGKLAHYEWCHLQGVCLGGKTNAGNLVCGHFALNTYMAVIESVLSSSGTQRRVRVTAWCDKQYVADWLRYEVFDLTMGNILPAARVDLWIDGRITKFSQNDQSQVIALLKQAGLG